MTSIEAGFIYLFKAFLGQQTIYNIGITNDVEKRFAAISNASPVPIYIDTYAFVPDPKALESELHSTYKDRRLHGEWFALRDEEATHVSVMFHKRRLTHD